MSLNSVNTNISAQVALQSLNTTNSQLQSTQKRISTGLRVADATDDGAAFAVAQKVRADTGALTTVNQQLGNAKGLVGTTIAGLTSISNSLTNGSSLLVKLSDSGISSDQRTQYLTQFKALVTQVASTVDGTTYNGKSLLGKTGDTTPPGAVSVVSTEAGGQTQISSEDNTQLAANLAKLVGLTYTAASGTTPASFSADPADSAVQAAAVKALQPPPGGADTTTIKGLQTTVAGQLNQASSDSNTLDATITFNSSKIDSLNAGLGALIDADLSKESANLQALQIRQQLGTQALSLANQSPQSLLSLFK
ncbi:MAG: flagellin [Deltaproteobacteria bacterium]|nr:MAG: flagellin [Deltaproteobacteria bacterium]